MKIRAEFSKEAWQTIYTRINSVSRMSDMMKLSTHYIQIRLGRHGIKTNKDIYPWQWWAICEGVKGKRELLMYLSYCKDMSYLEISRYLSDKYIEGKWEITEYAVRNQCNKLKIPSRPVGGANYHGGSRKGRKYAPRLSNLNVAALKG